MTSLLHDYRPVNISQELVCDGGGPRGGVGLGEDVGIEGMNIMVIKMDTK